MSVSSRSFSLAEDLDSREELTQVVEVSLSDKIISFGDAFLAAGHLPGSRILYVCLLDELASLLDHDDAVIDQVAKFHSGFGLKHCSCCFDFTFQFRFD